MVQEGGSAYAKSYIMMQNALKYVLSYAQEFVNVARPSPPSLTIQMRLLRAGVPRRPKAANLPNQTCKVDPIQKRHVIKNP